MEDCTFTTFSLSLYVYVFSIPQFFFGKIACLKFNEGKRSVREISSTFHSDGSSWGLTKKNSRQEKMLKCVFTKKKRRTLSMGFLFQAPKSAIGNVFQFFDFCLQYSGWGTVEFYDQWHNILAISVLLPFFENWSLGEKVDFYLFNLIEYFNLRGVGGLPGYILSRIVPFLSFWILRSKS